MSLISLLRRWHLLDPFDLKEATDAEIENVLRDHDVAMSRFAASDERIAKSQVKLKNSIEYARSSTESVRHPRDPIAQFVHDMRSSGHHEETK